MPSHHDPSTTPSSVQRNAEHTVRGRRRLLRRIGPAVFAASLTCAVAVSSPASSTPQAPSLPAGTYVALGDSYASGYGLPPYAEGTNVRDGNNCQRSSSAYAHQVAEQTGKTLDFDACSGARTSDFYQAKASWGEPAQLDHLDSSTGLVSFSIGGNDAGFAQILSKCVTQLPFSTCSGDSAITAPVDSAIDALAGKTTQEGVASYDTIMTDIGTRAPNAAVVAVGYPRMFTQQGIGQLFPVPGRCEGLTKVDQRWINARTNDLNAVIKAAALRHGYQFTDPSDSFTGHELCGKQGPWFEGLLEDGRFHPNAAGHKATADSVVSALAAPQAQEAAQDQPAAAEAQLDNVRPTGSFTLTRDGDQVALDASASSDADGAVTNIDWYIQRADGTEEVLTGAQATATVPASEQVAVTAVITDNQGKEDFTTQTAPATN